VILVFLSPPKPPETLHSDTDSNNILVTVLTPRQLACQVGGSVKCDCGSTVARATRLIPRVSGTTLDGCVCFLGEFSITASTFALGQVLNFGSLVYIVDCYSELRPLQGAASVGNKPSMLPPPPGLLGANLEVLALQI
jgi:hypothetical protein